MVLKEKWFQKKIDKARSWKSGSELVRITNGVLQGCHKKFFAFFSKLTVKSMKHKQEQENWDLGNREIANNQQLLSSHDVFNFVKYC